MKARFELDPGNRRPKVVRTARSEGEEGQIEEFLELKASQGEPLRKTPEAFESYTTRKKPPAR